MGRKTLLVAALCVAMASSSRAGVFADVPFTHWAYPAVERLASAGVLEGYPDGLYRGACPMTRYEFAVAAARMYDWVKKTVGGADPETLERILREQQAMNGRIDGLNNRVNDLDAKLTREVTRLDGRIDGIRPGTTGGTAFEIGPYDRRITALEEWRRGLNVPGPFQDDTTWRAWDGTLQDLKRLVDEFGAELKVLGADVAQMKSDLAALTGRVTALEGRVNNHESRIAALERFKFYGDVGLTAGFDGAPTEAGGLDGDLRFEAGEALMGVSARVGMDVKVSDDQAGRVTLWYDSDDNRFHGRPSDGRMSTMSMLGIDEAWVKTPGLGGKWIFGRQYGGQDYDTGEAKHALGLGTGYYTGAALNGGRMIYNLGRHIRLTGLAQADDSINPLTSLVPGVAGSGAANITGVARIDLGLPWMRDRAGNDGIRVGFMAVGSVPNNNNEVVPVVGAWKHFNDGSRTEEVSYSVDLHLNLLKGLDVEYTNQCRSTDGSGPDVNLNGDANGQVIYGKLGLLDTPTFKLNVAVGAVGPDYSLSYSGIMNPYQPNYIGTTAQLFTRPIMLGSLANQPVQGAPTQSFDVNFSWKLGNRPLNIRWAGSLRKKDAFDWMVYGEIPVVQTNAGNLKLGVGYVNAENWHVLGGNTMAANLSAGFRF